MTKKIEHCYSQDGEQFNHTELGDLIGDMQCDYEDSELIGMTYYKAEAHRDDGANLIDVDDILEMLGERAYDNYGECSEDWPDPSIFATQKLKRYLAGWIRKECPQNFWKVKNVEQCVIVQDDLS